MLNCPRDGTNLTTDNYKGIDVDRCPTCNGRWLDYGELDALEATAEPDENVRHATIEYAKNPSELQCPVCKGPMHSFNYRAYDLELDVCEQSHGFWLDAGEEGRVRDIIEDRVKGLARSATAEEAWAGFIGHLSRPTFMDKLKGMFGGRRR